MGHPIISQHPGLKRLPPTIEPGLPVTALAPMQDVTDLPFMTVVSECGSPDWFVTEYFRVTETSRLEKHILRSITENPTGRPVFAQIIGENIEAIRRTIRELVRYPIAGVDLNMGCPAPKVYRKNVGGGLLRDLPKIDQLLGMMREETPETRFTVKTRIGFEDTAPFDGLIELINKHCVDLLSLHGRTVKGLYRSEVDYGMIEHAAESATCPVLANGNVSSASKAAWVLERTGAAGIMVGRSAIRNPWIFRQIREHLTGHPVTRVSLREVRDYIHRLFEATDNPDIPDRARAGRMKKYLNFVGQSIDPEGAFLREMRRAPTIEELFAVCDKHLLREGKTAYLSDEPYPGVIARPNCETPTTDAEACSLDSVTA